MFHVLDKFKQSEHSPIPKVLEERADPKYFNYTWTNYLDYYEPLERVAKQHVGMEVENTDSSIQNALQDNLLHLDHYYTHYTLE